MRPPEVSTWRVLVPFDVREGVSLAIAAERAGKSQTTIRNWCNQHGIGRRVGGGVWIVSKVALAMYLDGDEAALRTYLSGDRSSPLVKSYYDRCSVPLPNLVAA